MGRTGLHGWCQRDLPGNTRFRLRAHYTPDARPAILQLVRSSVRGGLYAFQPTPEVRTFGRLVGHIDNANFMICGAATGQKARGGDIEKTATTKAALQKTLAESFAFLGIVQPEPRTPAASSSVPWPSYCY